MRKLEALSPHARELVDRALSSLPDDVADPVPLCARVACVLDALAPLTARYDLTADDRAIILGWCSDGSLLTVCGIVHAMDAFRMLRHARRRELVEERLP